MIDFIDAVKNILDEQGKTIDLMFSDGVISKNTFYKYRQRQPSLPTLIKVANYLQTTIDYMYGLSDKNHFTPYTTSQDNFYHTLTNMISHSHISRRRFCQDLHYSKDNIIRYKNGTQPNVRTLFEIADYFGCTIDDLLDKQKV